MARPRQKGKYYFSQYTEDAIVLHNTSEDEKEKHKIYTEEIHPAFDKLAENIIHRFKFYNLGESYEDLKAEGISFMYKQMSKFDVTRGAKAFSFFGTIIKRYYIVKSRKSMDSLKKELQLDNDDFNINFYNDKNLYYEQEFISDDDVFIANMVNWYREHMDIVFSKERDKKIVEAILYLFEMRKNIENFNKKALYIMIREITGCETNVITSVINKMKVSYVHLRQNFNNKGELISGSFTL